MGLEKADTGYRTRFGIVSARDGIVISDLLLAVPIFTRLLVPAEYGVYSLVAGTILLVGNLGSIWLAISIVRFYPVYEKEQRIDEFYSTIYHYVPHLLAAILLVALTLVALFLPLGKNRAVTCLGIAVFPLFWLFRVSQGLSRARRFSKFYAIQAMRVDAGRYLVGAALVARVGLGVKGIFVGWFGALVLVIIMQILVLSVWRYFRWDKYSGEPEMFNSMFIAQSVSCSRLPSTSGKPVARAPSEPGAEVQRSQPDCGQ